MRWEKVKTAISSAAPLIGGLFGGPAGNVTGALVAKALEVEPTPASIEKALIEDTSALDRIKNLEIEHEQSLSKMLIEAETTRLQDTNKTFRAELASNDPYVRRWRPTFGYIVAVTWALQTGVIVVAVVTATTISPSNGATILNGLSTLMNNLTWMWGIALAVLGVNVASRSKDKQVAAGQNPVGMLSTLASRISK